MQFVITIPLGIILTAVAIFFVMGSYQARKREKARQKKAQLKRAEFDRIAGERAAAAAKKMRTEG